MARHGRRDAEHQPSRVGGLPARFQGAVPPVRTWLLLAVFTPLLTVMTFVYLNGSGLLSVGEIAVPYVVYVVAGVAFWRSSPWA